VGRLAAEKNLDVLAEAFTLVATSLGRRVALAVAGDGPRAARLYDRVPGLRKLGFLRPGELAQVYASAAVCVFPSFTETCGLVALEAMASATAVVAADAGGFAENLAHGRTGLLVDPHDAAGFALSIVRLALDPVQRHVLGAAARRLALTRDRALEDEDLLAQYGAFAVLRRAGHLAPSPTRYIAAPRPSHDGDSREFSFWPRIPYHFRTGHEA
ncbi:MAG: glycosyltransferase, partial [Gemmatimonadota bacterium]